MAQTYLDQTPHRMSTTSSFSSHSGHADTPSADLETMLHDVSSRMARAKLARQVSSSSSVNLQRRAARILKTNSASTSPQHLQRRRTTASHKPTRHLSEYQSNNVLMLDQTSSKPTSAWSPSTARPVSWHPSSMIQNLAPPSTSSYDMSMMYPAMAYQTMAVYGLPTPMAQPELDNGVPIDCNFSLEDCSATHQPSMMGYNGFPSLSAETSAYFQYGSANPLSTNQYSGPSMPEDLSIPSSFDYSSQAWSGVSTAAPISTAPPTPDFLPIQHPLENWSITKPTPIQQLPKKQSKELVGMGLYDNPDKEPHSMNELMSGNAFVYDVYSAHESPGKGLKLEETWQPPEEDKKSEDEEDEDDGYSVDEGEEDLPISSIREKAQSKTHTDYGDLSNQSFFFDNDDAYVDGLAFNQHTMGPSKSLDAQLDSLTWI